MATKPRKSEPPRSIRPEGPGRLNRDSVLIAVGELVRREVDLDTLLAQVIDTVTKAMDADRGTFYLVDRARGELFSKAAHLPELREIRLALGQGVAGYVARTTTVRAPSSVVGANWRRTCPPDRCRSRRKRCAALAGGSTTVAASATIDANVPRARRSSHHRRTTASTTLLASNSPG